MHHKRLVIDANILIRAVLGNRVRNLLETYCENVAFYVAEANADEAKFYLFNVLATKHNLSSGLCGSIFDSVLNIVQVIPDHMLSEMEIKAKARIKARDINDWPVVATALLLECPIWTEDQDFFGSGVATWTTTTVELYLAES